MRTAILGSLLTIAITILVAFPIGVGAAIYLEEYAQDNWLNRLLQTNITNLAGVPSIIYGMLGLAIFVRELEPLTSGAIFGLTDPTTANGRTILSAGLTLALLVLPILIINGQEAIRAVPGFAAPGQLWVGSHQVADGLAPCTAQRHTGHPHRHHPGDLPRLLAKPLHWWWWAPPRISPSTQMGRFPNLPPCRYKFTSGHPARRVNFVISPRQLYWCCWCCC